MIGDIPIWSFIITGILLLIVWARIWSYEDKKKKEREKEKEEYRKKWEESEEFRKQEKEKYERGFKEFSEKKDND